MADKSQTPFVPIRKAGKLLCHTIEKEYQLEYGTASIEMHTDAIKSGWRVLIHDDYSPPEEQLVRPDFR